MNSMSKKLIPPLASRAMQHNLALYLDTLHGASRHSGRRLAVGIIGDRPRLTAKLIPFAHSTKESAVPRRAPLSLPNVPLQIISAMDSVRVLPEQR